MNNPLTAIFFDCENVSYQYVDDILNKLISDNCQILQKQAYADWSNMSDGWKQKCNEYAIKEVHVSSYKNMKNTSDIEIVMDVFETLEMGVVNQIILVTSDSDFRGLAQRIKMRGIHIIGFGEKKTSPLLRKSYSSFYELPLLSHPNYSESTVVDKIVSYMENRMNNKQPVFLAQIGTYLKDNIPYLSPNEFGFKTWRQFIQNKTTIFSLSYFNGNKSQLIVNLNTN